MGNTCHRVNSNWIPCCLHLGMTHLCHRHTLPMCPIYHLFKHVFWMLLTYGMHIETPSNAHVMAVTHDLHANTWWLQQYG